MPVEVILPRVDMDMATGRISKWHVKEGDTVAKGAALFEIETDKAAMEIEAPADGILAFVKGGPGSEFPVGVPVAWIFGAGEPLKEPSNAVSAATPAAKPAAAPAPMAIVNAAPDAGLRATPLARRLAREGGLDLSAITGSGPRGRIVSADIGTALETKAALPAPPAAALDPMRRTIAERLTAAKQQIPHFYLKATCDVSKLVAMRETLNAKAPVGGWKLSLNDFIVKAFALALQRVPAANVNWTAAGPVRLAASDVAIAVSVEGGLFTPVIRGAETKSLSAISSEAKELAARARARKLAPSEYQGGSAAVSNLGMYGTEEFTAIINPPQSSILAVGAVVERFVPVNGAPVLAKQMTCSLSCDHRAIDGALGAQLLAAFKALIEEPALMLV